MWIVFLHPSVDGHSTGNDDEQQVESDEENVQPAARRSGKVDIGKGLRGGGATKKQRLGDQQAPGWQLHVNSRCETAKSVPQTDCQEDESDEQHQSACKKTLHPTERLPSLRPAMGKV